MCSHLQKITALAVPQAALDLCGQPLATIAKQCVMFCHHGKQRRPSGGFYKVFGDKVKAAIKKHMCRQARDFFVKKTVLKLLDIPITLLGYTCTFDMVGGLEFVQVLH